jgi:hypothetical protein
VGWVGLELLFNEEIGFGVLLGIDCSPRRNEAGLIDLEIEQLGVTGKMVPEQHAHFFTPKR